MNLQDFLNYAGTLGGVNVIVGFILSFVAEWIPAYTQLESKPKRLIMMGLCFIVPVAGLAVRIALGFTVWGMNELWLALSLGFAVGCSGYFTSQVAHGRKLA